MRGPGIGNWFWIHESIRVRFRVKAYNALFGQMNAASAARIIQLALRFYFWARLQASSRFVSNAS